MLNKITDKFTKYVCNNEDKKFSELFTKNGFYHDYIYGKFHGKENIRLMLTDYFHKDAYNFYWEMYDHVFNEDIGYAKYRFAFNSKISEFKNKRVALGGISFFKIENGLISEYSESVNGGLAMVQLGHNPKRIEKVLLKWLKNAFLEDARLKALKK